MALLTRAAVLVVLLVGDELCGPDVVDVVQHRFVARKNRSLE